MEVAAVGPVLTFCNAHMGSLLRSGTLDNDGTPRGNKDHKMVCSPLVCCLSATFNALQKTETNKRQLTQRPFDYRGYPQRRTVTQDNNGVFTRIDPKTTNKHLPVQSTPAQPTPLGSAKRCMSLPQDAELHDLPLSKVLFKAPAFLAPKVRKVELSTYLARLP
eukprot:2549069-Amphidinium_carterae.1